MKSYHEQLDDLTDRVMETRIEEKPKDLSKGLIVGAWYLWSGSANLFFISEIDEKNLIVCYEEWENRNLIKKHECGIDTFFHKYSLLCNADGDPLKLEHFEFAPTEISKEWDIRKPVDYKQENKSISSEKEKSIKEQTEWIEKHSDDVTNIVFLDDIKVGDIIKDCDDDFAIVKAISEDVTSDDYLIYAWCEGVGNEDSFCAKFLYHGDKGNYEVINIKKGDLYRELEYPDNVWEIEWIDEFKIAAKCRGKGIPDVYHIGEILNKCEPVFEASVTTSECDHSEISLKDKKINAITIENKNGPVSPPVQEKADSVIEQQIKWLEESIYKDDLKNGRINIFPHQELLPLGTEIIVLTSGNEEAYTV